MSQVNLDNYAGPWCVEPSRFNQVVNLVNGMDLAAHIAAQPPRSITTKQHRNSVAVIDIEGTMTKGGSSLGGGSTVEARRAIRAAGESDVVKSIVLRIDSPGGTVSGTSDLAAEVAKTTKPIVAFVEDFCASAAYWVASQCDSIYANTSTAQIGSIGTFMALYDISGALEGEKVKTIVVKAGEFKAGGFPGTKISKAQVAEWQKLIDATQAQFTKAIAAGRGMGMRQAEQLNTGLVYIAADARKLGLIDGIKTFDEVVEGMRNVTSRKGPMIVSQSNVASFKEIVAACPGIDTQDETDALFVAECLRAGDLTATEVQHLYCDDLQNRICASEEAGAALQTQADSLRTPTSKGVSAIGTKTTSAAEINDFEV
ncbi:MAG: S49 family peptidase, partial [Planctomycetaceae bacterium]